MACLLGLGLSARPAVVAAQIYAGRDADGHPLLTNLPGDPTLEIIVEPVVVEAAASPLPPDGRDAAQPAAGSGLAYGPLVAAAARRHRLQPALLHAVIRVESGYNARAVSRKGAQGLMQLMPGTSRRLGIADPFSPADNVMGGARHLRELLDRFGGRLELAIAAYNAGEDAVVRAGYRLPPFAETRRYVPAVLAHLRAYELRFGAVDAGRPEAGSPDG